MTSTSDQLNNRSAFRRGLAGMLILSVCTTAQTAALPPEPSPRQVEWQKQELQVLIHFGVNTFSGREWGTGRESPRAFSPSGTSPLQWVTVARGVGAKTVILTAKHHDGFCLWPSAFTEFSVKSSSWVGGYGDLVGEVSEACLKAGLKFGIYLSPADMNHPSYGRNSARYNDYFCNQLRELLTNYGEISQVFFDGAQPIRDRKQDYDWQRYYKIVRELQPNAVIAIQGPDVRWVGNEVGRARLSEWSVIPLPEPPEQHDWKDKRANDLGSREKIKDAKYLHWYPAVATVSLRPNWFWRPNTEETIKTVPELLRIYEETVGRNCGLLLGIAPDTTGRIPDPDVAVLREFGELIERYFTTNLVSSSNANLTIIEDTEDLPTHKVRFQQPRFVRYVVLREDITKGQHIEKVNVTLRTESGERLPFEATTVGWKRILKVETPEVREIEIKVLETRAPPHLSIEAY